MVEETSSYKGKCGRMTDKDFIEWVISEIFDEDKEYNKGAFAENACRKLVSLGYLEEKDGYYHIKESGNDKQGEKTKNYDDIVAYVCYCQTVDKLVGSVSK